MMTVATFIILTGFYVLYLSSEKIVAKPGVIRTIAVKNKKIAGLAGSIGLLLGFLTFCFHLGTGAGILAGFIALMTVACLIIIIAPLRLVNTMHMLALFVICLIIEELNILL